MSVIPQLPLALVNNVKSITNSLMVLVPYWVETMLKAVDETVGGGLTTVLGRADRILRHFAFPDPPSWHNLWGHENYVFLAITFIFFFASIIVLVKTFGLVGIWYQWYFPTRGNVLYERWKHVLEGYHDPANAMDERRFQLVKKCKLKFPGVMRCENYGVYHDQVFKYLSNYIRDQRAYFNEQLAIQRVLVYAPAAQVFALRQRQDDIWSKIEDPWFGNARYSDLNALALLVTTLVFIPCREDNDDADLAFAYKSELRRMENRWGLYSWFFFWRKAERHTVFNMRSS
jgi:hypothetical protein